MDRKQIEADVAWFERELANVEECYADPDRDAGRLRRAIARLRADLAKMDGPAEGFVRVRIGVSVSPYGGWCSYGCTTADYSDVEAIQKQCEHNSGDLFAWVIADVPLPRVVEVAGTVEEVKP